MALDINSFSAAAKLDGRLSLADNRDGIPTLITAKAGFKEKVLSVLSHIPLLGQMQAVRDYVDALSIDNRQVLGVFLAALSARFGDEAARNASDAIDLSGKQPLTLRSIVQLTTQCAHFAHLSDTWVQDVPDAPEPTHNSAASRRPMLEQRRGADANVNLAVAASHAAIAPQVFFLNHEQGIEQLLSMPVPQALLMPRTQTWLASWLYSEPESIQTLQRAIGTYNQELDKCQLAARLQCLTLGSDPLADIATLTEDFALAKEGLDRLNRALAKIAACLVTVNGTAMATTKVMANLSAEQGDALLPLQTQIAQDLQHYKALAGVELSCEQTFLASLPTRQGLAEFIAALPSELQDTLTAGASVLSYQMFAPMMRGELGQADLVAHVAAVLTRDPDEPSTTAVDAQSLDVNALVLLIKHFLPRQANASSVGDPSVMETAELDRQLAQMEQAQRRLAEALSQASQLSGEALVQLRAEIKLDSHVGAVQRAAASLNSVLLDYDEVEDHSASLLYLSGQHYVVKGSRLLFDEPIEWDHLDIEQTQAPELDKLAQLPDMARLAQRVLQTQHRLDWFAGNSSVSFSPNNPQDIPFNDDVQHLRLGAQIVQHQAGYHLFLAERQSLCHDYRMALTDILQALPPCEVRAQLALDLTRIAGDSEANRLLVERLNQLQQAQHVLGVAEAKVARFSALSQQLKQYSAEVNAQRASLNLQHYLSYLPALQANNDRVRDLSQARLLLTDKLAQLTAHLQQLYGADLRRILTDDASSSPELRAYQTVARQLTEVECSLADLDEAYQHGLLQLKKASLAAKDQGGYPEQGAMTSGHAWQTWLVQKFVGHWSSQYRPSIEELILARQLAKNNLSSMAEAYLALANSVKGSKASLTDLSALGSPQAMMAALGQVHNWSMAHPLEAQALAGNLTQAYNIILANPSTFGQELVGAVTTVWQTGTVQNQVQDMLQGTREALPDKANFAMTPQMIALLHMAQLAPYIAGGAKGAVNTGVGGPLVNGVFSMMFPGAGVAAPIVGLVGGLLQTWSERQVANNMRAYRSTEVMVNALIKGMQAEGGLAARGEAMAGYMLQRQALQDIGTVSRDCFEVGKVGAIKRALTDIAHWWKQASTGAKAFAVVTAILVATVVSASAVAGALFALGTGGVGIVAAVVLCVGGLMAGAYFARALMASLQGINFLGMGDAARAAKADMTQSRIETALNRVAHTAVKGEHAASVSIASILPFAQDREALKARLIPQLSGLDDEVQRTVFATVMLEYAQNKRSEIESIQELERQQLVERAVGLVDGLDITQAQLTQCMAEIDAALSKEKSV